jgi:hypothetical protein
MNTYLVRTLESQRLVGMFLAHDAAGLFYVLDELFDPFSCEFLQMLPGDGMFFDAQFSVVTEKTPSGEEYEYVALHDVPEDERDGVCATDALEGRLDAAQDFGWSEFTDEDAAVAYRRLARLVAMDQLAGQGR